MNKNYLIILLILSLLLTGCSSKSNDLLNLKSCQDSCLNKNMSFNSYTLIDSRNMSYLQCTCNSYLEVELSVPIIGAVPDLTYDKLHYIKQPIA